MAFSDAFLDELRARVPVSEVVGRRVRLTRKGRELWGLCPFHNEKTPSFKVNDDRQRYHCFGCGQDGTAIDFVIATEGLTFREAVERMAGDAGMALPQETPEEREAQSRRKTLYEAVAAAAVWFETQLLERAGEAARDYLKRRGLDREAAKQFRLGFAPDSRRALRGALSAKGYDDALMLEAGLLIKPEDGGEPYDFFRGRVIFPIADRQGRIVAFGARALGDGEPKYLNSRETPIFPKSRTLYGLAVAREAARHGEAIVVAEGYMDVIALARAGFEGAVAPLGTALTSDHLAEIWRLVPEPIICLDGDAAGQKAALRSAERALPMLGAGKSLRFATLPEKHDPDSLLKAEGKAAMQAVLDRARPLAEILWEAGLAGKTLDTPERRAALVKHFRDLTSQIEDPTVNAFYRQMFKDRLGELFHGGRRTGRPAQGGQRSGFGRPGQRRGGFANASWAPETKPRSGLANPEQSRERAIVLGILHHPSLLENVEEEFADYPIENKELSELRQAILAARHEQISLDFQGLKSHLEGSGLAELLSRNQISPADPPYVRPEASDEDALAGFREAVRLHHDHAVLRRESETELAALGGDISEAEWDRLQARRKAELAAEERAREEEAQRE